MARRKRSTKGSSPEAVSEKQWEQLDRAQFGTKGPLPKPVRKGRKGIRAMIEAAATPGELHAVVRWTGPMVRGTRAAIQALRRPSPDSGAGIVLRRLEEAGPGQTVSGKDLGATLRLARKTGSKVSSLISRLINEFGIAIQSDGRGEKGGAYWLDAPLRHPGKK